MCWGCVCVEGGRSVEGAVVRVSLLCVWWVDGWVGLFWVFWGRWEVDGLGGDGEWLLGGWIKRNECDRAIDRIDLSVHKCSSSAHTHTQTRTYLPLLVDEALICTHTRTHKHTHTPLHIYTSIYIYTTTI